MALRYEEKISQEISDRLAKIGEKKKEWQEKLKRRIYIYRSRKQVKKKNYVSGNRMSTKFRIYKGEEKVMKALLAN